VQEIIEDCSRADIPCFSRLYPYSHVQGESKTSRASGKRSARPDKRDCSTPRSAAPEVLKLEFPVNPEVNADETYWRRHVRRVTESAPAHGRCSVEASNAKSLPQVEAACKSGAPVT
jgi:hypothetical protein